MHPLVYVDPRYGNGSLCPHGEWNSIHIVLDPELWNCEEPPYTRCISYESGYGWRVTAEGDKEMLDVRVAQGFARLTDPNACWELLLGALAAFEQQAMTADANWRLVGNLLNLRPRG